MNILDVINSIDLDLLKKQYRTVVSCIENIDCEIYQESLVCRVKGRTEALKIHKSNLEGVLELIDNLVIGLENE